MPGNNPFCLSFGKEPDRYVERAEACLKITETLNSISPSNNCFMIMGIRGCGKTVLLSSIANEYRKNSEWVVISLNPGRGLLEMLAAGLYEDSKLQKQFIKASLNLSKFGIGVKLEKVSPISDIQIAIERMLKIVKEQGKRVLITIDDITKSKDVIGFASAFQDWISKGLPIFLLMTGLYENVYSLQTDSRCSFLMRAERILLMPLNMIGMKNQYKQTFQCTDEEALEMADFTKGYSYAFQVLGYIMWEAECSLEEAIPRFDERMSGYCYEKIWDDLSEKEKVIISLLASNGKMRTRDVIDKAELSEKTYSVIRDRLVKKGLVDGREYGFIKLLLPRFEEYVKTVY